jgi:hypothetical protein
MDETNFRDSNSFLIDGKSFVVRYFPASETSILVRTNSVPLTSEEQAISTANPDSVTTGGGLNYGDIAAGGVALQGGVAPEAFKNQYANDLQLQQTIENATRSVTGPIPLPVIPAPPGTTGTPTPPSSPDQGGSNPINPAPPGTPQQPESLMLYYPNDIASTKQDVITFETFDYKSGIGSRLSPEDGVGKFGELKPVQFEKTKEPIIVLPIQSSITDQNSVGWESDTMNPLEIEAAELSYGLMTTGNKSGRQLGEEISAIVGRAFSRASNAAKENGVAIRTYLVGQALGVNNLQSRLNGQVLNPNLELLFQGPQLRPFNFTFKMSPRDRKEAESVKKIINFFKKNMAARKDNVVFLKAPRVFKIKYLYGLNRETHPAINLIKMCALTNCSVDYTPLGSYATYNDGTMVAYNVTLSFQELTPIYNTDYEKFDYGDGKDIVSNHPIGA